APEVLYGEPETPFVAGFVGGANLVRGRAEGSSFLAGEVRLTLPAAAEGEGVLAVRPEDVALEEGGTPLVLAARLFLGHAVEYRLQLAGELLRIVAPPTAYAPGDLVPVRLLRARFFPSAPGGLQQGGAGQRLA